MRYYVISDVHGFYTPMTDTLKRAGYFDDPQPHKLIILGDLFDRGTEAPALQEFVIDLIERDAVILIRGNHEDLYEELATVDQGQPFSHHISNGTYDTALQLTGMDKWMALIHQYDFAEAAQDTPYYKRIIPAMQNYYETAHYIFVHGWIPCLRERTTYCSIGNWRKADDNMWSTARWFNGMDANQFVYEDGKTKVEQGWKRHLCSANGITLVEISLDKKTDPIRLLSTMKKAFQKKDVFINSDFGVVFLNRFVTSLWISLSVFRYTNGL